MKYFILIVVSLSSSLFALEEQEATHLLWRTGFGPDPQSMAELKPLSRVHAVDAILAQLDNPDVLKPLDWTGEVPAVFDRSSIKGLPEVEARKIQKAFRKEREKRGRDLRYWWMNQMIQTKTPFVERLALMWHDHFTSELSVVKEPWLMWNQHQLIRQHMAGNFRQFLDQMTVDGAMLVYLDGSKNSKGKPNENFARELFELFTLGEGHYSEDDIIEASKALTGWRLNRQNGQVVFVERRHDAGSKTVFGETGNFSYKDILDITLARERTATYLTERFWIAFISDQITEDDRSEITRLASILRDGNYELRPFLREMLLSDSFWNKSGSLVKAPIDMVVPTMRMLGPRAIPLKQLDRATIAMGQKLFDPPGVQGWPDGADWLDSDALLTRWELLARAARLSGSKKARLEGGWLAEINKMTNRDDITGLLLATDALTELPMDDTFITWLDAVLRDPAFQVR